MNLVGAPTTNGDPRPGLTHKLNDTGDVVREVRVLDNATTPALVPLTSAVLDVKGAVSADSWILNLGGVARTIPATAGTTRDGLEGALASAINGLSITDVTADATGTDLTITAVNGATFTLAIRISGEAPASYADIDVTPAATHPLGGVDWDEVNLAFDDDRTDETFTVTLTQGSNNTVGIGVAPDVGADLTDAFSGYSDAGTGSTLNVKDDVPFSVDISVAAAGGASTSDLTDAAIVTLVFPSGHTPAAGDVWRVSLDLALSGMSGDFNLTTNTATTVEGAAAELAALFDARPNFTTAYETGSNTFTIIRTDTTMFTTIVEFATAAAATDFATAGSATDATTRTVTLTETANIGDSWTLKNGSTLLASHTVLAVNDVAADFASEIDSSGAYNAYLETSGNSFVIVRIDDSAFNATLDPVTRSTTAPTGSVTSGTPDVTWTQTITLAPGDPTDKTGDIWRVDVAGNTESQTVDTTVSATDTAGEAVATAILGSSAFTGTAVPGSGNTVVVTSSDGSPITVGNLRQTRADAFTGTPGTPLSGPEAAHFFDATIDLSAVFDGPYTRTPFTFTIDGDVITHKPVAAGDITPAEDRTGETVVRDLVAALDAGTRFNVTVNGSGIVRITDPTGVDPFNVKSEAGGSITVVVDIDDAAPIETFEFYTGRFFDIRSVFDSGTVIERVATVRTVVVPTVSLFDPSGIKLAETDLRTGTLDRGSDSLDDPLVSFEVDVEGIYVVRVGSRLEQFAPVFETNPFNETYENPFSGVFGGSSTRPNPAHVEFDRQAAAVPNSPFLFEGGGVPFGEEYRLVVSVPGHKTNASQLDLIGTTVTILDGPAIGSTATVAGYEPDNHTFVLDRLLDVADVASDHEFELSFDPYVAYSDYGTQSPVNDSYNVVLTVPPIADVTVDVTPKRTRTFDTERVFDADVDFGQRDEIQVEVATPEATLTFDGAVIDDETWIIKLRPVDAITLRPTGGLVIAATFDGADWEANVRQLDPAGQVVAAAMIDATLPGTTAGLATLIDLVLDDSAADLVDPAFTIDTLISATPSGSTVELSGIGTVETSFFASVAVEGDSAGLVFIDDCNSGDLEDRRCNSKKVELPFKNRTNVLTLEVGGVPVQGDTWNLALTDGIATYPASAMVGFRGDLASIADEWANDLASAPFDILVVGLVLVISARGDGPIDATANIVTASPTTGDITSKQFDFTNDSGKLDEDKGQPTNDHGAATVQSFLTFTPTNWATPQTVTVMAIDDDFIDGGDALVFPAFEERVNPIRGPLSIIGGLSDAGERSINDPFGLPDETNFLLSEGYVGTATEVPSGAPAIFDGVLFDELADHVNATTGERPGFDPRMNDFDYVVTFLDPITGQETKLDVARQGVTSDILSLLRKDPFAVGSFSSPAPTTAPSPITFRGTPEQTASTDLIEWSQATIDLAGEGRSAIPDDANSVAETWTITLTGAAGVTVYPLTVAVGDESPARIALKLAQDISADITNGYTARVAVGILGDARLVITRDDNTVFSVSTEITPATTGDPATALPVSGTFVVGGTPVVSDISAHMWTSAAWFFDLDATVEGTWTINAGGVPHTVTMAAGSSIADLTSALATEVRIFDATQSKTDRLAPAISGTTVTFDGPWPDGPVPSGLEYSISPFNPNEAVNEVDQVDTLNVSHGNSPADDIGYLTTDRLTGLGMGPDAIIGGQRINGGITYSALEEIFIELGTGDNHFVIESTHEGSTTITSGPGADVFDINEILGHTEIYTGANSDIVNVGSQVSYVAPTSTGDTAHLVNTIGALLTIDGGTDEITGTGAEATITTTVLDDQNADFPTRLGNVMIDYKRFKVDVRTQADIGELSMTVDALTGVPTGELRFEAKDRFEDHDVFVFNYELCQVLSSELFDLCRCDRRDTAWR